MPKLIRLAEAAALLQIDATTVRLFIKRGHFPRASKMDPTRKNSPYQIPLEDVENFIKARAAK